MAKDKHLTEWEQLNLILMNSDKSSVEKLLNQELKNKKRKIFVLRIHSRLNRLRADEERKSLIRICRGENS
jgi:hypothetical protein